MKKQNTLKKLTTIFIMLFASLLFSTSCYAADTDVINNYEINISPRKNGTLFLTYSIDWEVLDSSNVGPLIDLYVGVPNKNISEIKPISQNIEYINYTNNSYGSSGHYLYIKFNEKYYTGDVAKVKFSFVVSHMYLLEGDNCFYHFTPGWFNDVEVKNFKATCKSKGVILHDATKTVGEKLVWEYPLAKGEAASIQISYPQSVFTVLDANEQKSNTDTFNYYADNYSSSHSDLEEEMAGEMIVTFIVFFIIVFAIVIALSSKSSYYNHSGYGYTRIYDYDDDDDYFMRSGYHSRYYHTRPPRRRPPRPSYSIFSNSGSSWSSSSWSDSGSSSSSSSRSSISSCACACACAGGGRAGCSKKELYHFNAKDLKNVLKK